MNLIITRTKQEQTYVGWEPCATSTPLKIVPDNVKILFENELQKKMLKNNDSNFGGVPLKGFAASSILQGRPTESKHMPLKKAMRTKSSAYLDSSSSSSDDDSREIKNRPIIKLNCKKNTRSFICNKKPKREETEEVNEVNIKQRDDSSKKINNFSYSNRKKNSVIDLKVKNGRSQNVKIKTRHTSENLKADFKSIHLSSDKNSVNDIKPSLVNKENINYTNSDDKFKHFNNNVIKNEEIGVKEMSKILVQCKYNKRSQSQKNLLKIATHNHKAAKLRKGINNTNSVGPLKKTSTVRASGKPAKQSVSLDNTVAPVDNKTNLSHQLFSDSREQEFINTLDLTSEEINDAIDVKFPLWQKKQNNLPHKQSSPNNSIQNQSNLNKDISENNEGRPKRRREEPKQFWLPKNTSKNALNTNKKTKPKRNTKTSTKTGGKTSKLYPDTTEKEQDTVKELKENNQAAESTSERAPRAGRKRKTANVSKKNVCAPDDALNISFKEKKLKNGDANCVFSCSSEDIDKKAEPSKALSKDTALEKKTDKTVFKQLNELSFNGNEMGCSTALCWNVNNFKCGVFKLKAESQLCCKTLHSNSHLGGVLIKGTLKMKIRDTELELKEGDMAFVPPLTEWNATNIGQCESVFYYWCGRFK